ncbi:helix-turn-helix transcriptional regulator [Pedobacter steynii]|nr:helix-turn-helix transcriptional regulator [Pedobacter steynii]NQX43287.1 helix-turn-helix transcriptional regulator [Pedobacter steynii]
MNLVHSIPVEQVGTCPEQMHHVISLIMQKKFHATEIGDYFLGNVLVDNQKVMVSNYANQVESRLLNQNDKEAHRLWLAYFEFFFPPEDDLVIEPDLFDAIREKEHWKVHFFFQRLRPSKKSDYKWHFSTSRLCCSAETSSAKTSSAETEVSPILFHYAFELNISGCGSESLEEADYAQKYHSRFELLSKREKEIIKLIVEGKSSCEISMILYISTHTVNNHRKNIIRKLEINNLCQLTKFAMSFHII